MRASATIGMLVATACAALLAAAPALASAPAHGKTRVELGGADTSGDAVARLLEGAPSSTSIVGTDDDDVVTGTPRGDRISGNGGDDVINAGNGNDEIWGDDGNDTLNGEGGNDRIHAGGGADTVNGGDGNDVIYANSDDGAVDHIDCGAGRDKAIVYAGDVTVNCEQVQVVGKRGKR